MNVVVGIQEGGFNGIDAYAEHVAAAGAELGANMTLLTSTPAVAETCRARLHDDRIRVLDIGLTPPSRGVETMQRLWHGVRMRRLGRALHDALSRLGRTFDVIHLNHPGLAGVAREHADRIVVAAWFWPHSPIGRVRETWRHTRGGSPRRLVLSAKSIVFYRSDQQGYRIADAILCPTRTLADQLTAQGRPAMVCPPPIRVHESADDVAEDHAGKLLLVCCGDLSHPRKNVRDVAQAAKRFSADLGPITLRFVGGHAGPIEQAVRGLPDHAKAEFPGRVEPSRLHAMMRTADALVMPSLYEEWGYVAVESLFCGLPVVAYPVYPFADMLAGGLGTVADDRTPAALAAAIERQLAAGRDDSLADRARERFGPNVIGTLLRRAWEYEIDEQPRTATAEVA
ncbi:MAG: glycosyltransferase family 4 protein [Phycisphaerales bacterium]|nr:glycosyltransferase family 4 protein [Phycisphaerales bacterium]